jgi:hypothetical protein
VTLGALGVAAEPGAGPGVGGCVCLSRRGGDQRVGCGAHREHLAGCHRRPADEPDRNGAGGMREAVIADDPAPRTSGKLLYPIEERDG